MESATVIDFIREYKKKHFGSSEKKNIYSIQDRITIRDLISEKLEVTNVKYL